jgi:hypothetical protein
MAHRPPGCARLRRPCPRASMPLTHPPTTAPAAPRSSGVRGTSDAWGVASALYPRTGSALPILPQSVPLGRLISFILRAGLAASRSPPISSGGQGSITCLATRRPAIPSGGTNRPTPNGQRWSSDAPMVKRLSETNSRRHPPPVSSSYAAPRTSVREETLPPRSPTDRAWAERSWLC